MAKYLLTYDVATFDKEGEARLRKVARMCEGYGFRVQKSVFELILEKKDLTALLHKLESIIKATSDSVRIYTIRADEVHTLGSASDETAISRYMW